MNILLRKLMYNDTELHLISWNNKPCFIVSELSATLDISKEDIPLFLRKSGKVTKGIEYDLIEGSDAMDLKNSLSDCSIQKRFVHTTLIYMEGLEKYFLYRKTQQNKDFRDYIIANKISLDTLPNEINQPAQEPINKPSHDTAKVNKNCNSAPSANCHNQCFTSISKTLDFVDEFVDSFNKVNITTDKANAFTKSIAKFLESKGLDPEEMLSEIKKWIV